MTTPDDLRALLLELYVAPFTAKSLRGKQAGMADLTMRLPSATVKRFWTVAKAIKDEDATTLPAADLDPPMGPPLSSHPHQDGDVVRYGTGG